MSIDFSSLDFSAEAIKKMREQAKKEIEGSAIELAKKKAACFDSLIVYLDDLRRIREQYTAFRMYYFGDYPEGDEEPRVSKDEIILDSMIRIMAASNSALHNQILGRGYRKDNPKFEEEMERIHKAAEE